MKQLSLLFCIICIAALTGCNMLGNKNKVRGSGTAKTETRALAPFTAVEVRSMLPHRGSGASKSAAMITSSR